MRGGERKIRKRKKRLRIPVKVSVFSSQVYTNDLKKMPQQTKISVFRCGQVRKW